MTARKPLTQRQKQALYDAQSGICACGCGSKLEWGRFEDDHTVPLCAGGTNDIENRRLITMKCHKRKSVEEQRVEGKIRRLKYGRTKIKYRWPSRKFADRAAWLAGKVLRNVDQ